MLYSGIIAVCSQIYTNHIHALRGGLSGGTAGQLHRVPTNFLFNYAFPYTLRSQLIGSYITYTVETV
jgi:hypothetical protein